MGYILIVEDDVSNRYFITANLRIRQYLTKAVDNAEEALLLIQEQIPALILTDYRLGEKNGLELVKDLSSNPLTSQIPVIVMSIFLEGEQQEIKATYPQIAEIMIKPFPLIDLLKTVQKYVPPPALTPPQHDSER